LWQGARTVLSFEPEGRNYALLERSARAFRARGRDWQTFQAAVASWRGRGTLHLRESSLSHSLLEVGRPIVGATTVDVVAMSEVIARGRASGSPLIVKLDVEGLECDIVERTDAAAWRAVDRLYLEYHQTAPCREDELVTRLERVGLRHRGRTLEIPGYDVAVFTR
jgi:FkbM family methyltransferase